MAGQSADADSRYHRFRLLEARWLWLIAAAVVAYGLLVAVMVLSAQGSASASRALAGAPTAAFPVEPVALHPAPAVSHPRGTAAPEPATGAVYYTPADAAGESTAAAPVPVPGATAVTPEVSAQQAVDRAQQSLTALRAGGKATAAELAAARYELTRAQQNLADLTAGTPGKAHHDLDVIQARVYRDLAVERCRTAMTDPSASQTAQDQAYALVLQWQKRLDTLLA